MKIDHGLRYIPTDKQAEAHRCPARYVLFGGAMRSAKSAWLVNEAIALSIETPGNRGFIGRYEASSFMKTTNLELFKFLPEELIDSHNKRDRVIRLINGSEIIYGGVRATQAEKPLERLKSMTLGWFALDEASEISEEVFMMLCTRLSLTIKRDGVITMPRYKGILASNAEPCWLKARFVDEQHPDHAFISARPDDNPHNAPNYIDDLKSLFGEGEGFDEWCRRYLEGSWEEAGSAKLMYPYSIVQSAMDREVEPGYPIELGVDVAGCGEDKTVAVLRRGSHYETVWEAFNTRTPGRVEKIRELYKAYDCDLVKIDAVGEGSGTYECLSEIKGINCLPYKSSFSARNKAKYADYGSESAWELRLMLESGEIQLPDDVYMRRELTSMLYFDDRGKIETETKKRRKTRGLKSPNRADALIICSANPIMAVARGRVCVA